MQAVLTSPSSVVTEVKSCYHLISVTTDVCGARPAGILTYDRIRRLTWHQWVAPALRLSPRWEVRWCACRNYELSVEGGMQDTKNIRYSSDFVMFLHVRNIWEL